MAALIRDLSYALRQLRASPGFTAVAVVTIALAIGANTAIFSYVNGMLLNPLPFPDAERMVRVLERRPDGGRNGISTLNFLDWAEQNTVFEHLAAQSGWSTTMTGGEEPMRLRGLRVSPSFFEIYPTQAALGRKFLPGEDEVGHDRVVLLGHPFWQSQFGGDPDIVGRDLVLDGDAHTVVGILPAGSMFDRMPAQLYKPLAFEPAQMTRDFHWFGAVGRIRAGITLEQAQAGMDVIGKRLSDTYPESNKDWSVAVDPLADVIVGDDLELAVIVMFAATISVLLIGCANLASLALARGLSRAGEVAVRGALGAGRWPLARQFLTENVLLALAGGGLGIGVAFATLAWIGSLVPPNVLPAEVDVSLDLPILLFALALAVGSGLLFGLAPALQAGRTDLVGVIKEGGQSTTPGSAGRRFRATLVVTEIALAFVLLVGSGLLMRSLFMLLETDPGFDSGNVLTAGLPIAQQQYPDPVELNNYLTSIRSAVETLPGVRETAVTSALPLQGWGYGMPYLVAGRDFVDRANRQAGFFKMVSPGYFEALRIELAAGRTLSETDTAGAPPVMIINETMARREFADEDPIGRRIEVQQIVPGVPELGAEIAWEIVGVIRDEKVGGLDDDSSAGMYVSSLQSPVYGVSLLVRAETDPQGLERSLRTAIAGVNGNQALSDVRTLEQIESQALTPWRVQSILLGTFAAVALALAAIGIYGVMAYSTEQRTNEIGIRAALGASDSHLRGLIFRSGMRLAVIGLVVGIAASLASTRVMASLLYGVSVYDPLTLAIVAAILALVAAIACLVPALRATRVDPIVALRCQ